MVVCSLATGVRSAREFPELVELDLGLEWKSKWSSMVFGVFAARRDSDMAKVKLAHDALIEQQSNSKPTPK